jgi:hypothetical protein
MAVEAFIIRRGASLSLCIRLRLCGLLGNLSLGLGLKRPSLPLLAIILNHHHMIGTLLDAFLNSL